MKTKSMKTDGDRAVIGAGLPSDLQCGDQPAHQSREFTEALCLCNLPCYGWPVNAGHGSEEIDHSSQLMGWIKERGLLDARKRRRFHRLYKERLRKDVRMIDICDLEFQEANALEIVWPTLVASACADRSQ